MKIELVIFMKKIAGSAVGSGCYRWFIRRSTHSFTGWVLVAVFRNAQWAKAFAERWAGKCGYRFCAIRFRDGAWSVSVPVAGPAWAE